MASLQWPPIYNAGLEKVLSTGPGQRKFPSGQVAFFSHLPNGQGTRQVVCYIL